MVLAAKLRSSANAAAACLQIYVVWLCTAGRNTGVVFPQLKRFYDPARVTTPAALLGWPQSRRSFQIFQVVPAINSCTMGSHPPFSAKN